MMIDDNLINDVPDPKFISNVLNKIDIKNYYKLKRSEIDNITKKTIEKLGLNSKFQLNDRLEGLQFLNNMMKEYGAINSTLKNITILTKYSIEKNVILTGNKKYLVKYFDYGNLPSINKQILADYEGVFFVLCQNTELYIFCGFISSEQLISINLKPVNTTISSNIYFFENFELLNLDMEI